MRDIVSRDTHRAAFPLAGDGSAWRVDSGAVDVFFVHVNNGIVNAPYKHVLRAAEGQVIFGVDPLDLATTDNWSCGPRACPASPCKPQPSQSLSVTTEPQWPPRSTSG